MKCEQNLLEATTYEVVYSNKAPAVRRGGRDHCITRRIHSDLKSKEYYQLDKSASGSPATRASRMPMLMPSWFSDPRALRSSMGAICHTEIN